MSLKLTETQAKLLFALEPSSKIYKPVRQHKARRRFFGLAPALAYGTRHQWDHQAGRALQRWWGRHGLKGLAWVVLGVLGVAALITGQSWALAVLGAAIIAFGIDLITPAQRKPTRVAVKDTPLARVIAEHMGELPEQLTWWVNINPSNAVYLDVRNGTTKPFLRAAIHTGFSQTRRAPGAWVDLRTPSYHPHVRLDPEAKHQGVESVLKAITEFVEQTHLLREDPQHVHNTPLRIERTPQRERIQIRMFAGSLSFARQGKYAMPTKEPQPFQRLASAETSRRAADLWIGWLAAWLALDTESRA